MGRRYAKDARTRALSCLRLLCNVGAEVSDTERFVDGLIQQRLERRGEIAHALVRLLYMPTRPGDDGATGLTLCNHLYDIGICVMNWDDVSCRSCLRQGTENWEEAKEIARETWAE